MDSHNPPKPGNLLNDLESIRQLLDQQQLEPPLLTESVDTSAIPLLCDIVPPSELVPPRPSLAAALHNRPDPAPSVAPVSAPVTPAPTAPTPTASAINASLQQRLHPGALELQRVDRELRAAAQLLQDVIDDFVPQIEAELKRRLDVRLDLLLSQRKP